MDEVTYYYDAYVASQWANPANIVDGSLATYASCASSGDEVIVSSTTSDGTNLGTITKVELRGYGYGDGNDRIDFSFHVSRDTEYQVTMPASEGWCAYQDVTDDPYINGWTWAKVANAPPYLRLEYAKVKAGNPIYCAKVEIRVTYTPGVPAKPVSRGHIIG